MMRAILLRLSRSKRLARLASTNSLARHASRRFVAGESVEEAMDYIRDLNASGLLSTLDRLGENVSTEEEASAACDAYLDMLDRIRATGVRSTISVKLTSMGLDIGDRLAAEHVRRIAQRAAEGGPPIQVTIDMEGSAYTQRTLDIFHEAHSSHPHVSAVVQSMLYRTEQDIEDLISVGASVRLCKGAYLEPSSVAYPDKKDSDASFVRIVGRMLSADALAKGAYIEVATQDEAIIDWTKAHAAENSIGLDQFEFQMLNGVRRDLQAQLVRQGYRVRVYVPYGTHWYPYYVRRLAERPENLAFVVRGVIGEIFSRRR